MKRSGFKNKPRKPMKRTPLKRVSPNKVKKSKTSIYKWTPPKWIGGIPQGSHGSTSIQKKTWKVISDFVRIKDYYNYGGICPGCMTFKFYSYKDMQAGHWKSWGASNSYAKYEMRNLCGICANCNNNENGQIGFNIGMELIARYGEDNPEYIDEQNNYHRGKKMEDIVLVGIIEMLINRMKDLPEKPDWYNKVVERMSYEEQR